MRKILSILFGCALFSFAGAQSAFVKAYIVNTAGDTIKGEVKVNPKKELTNFNKVTFKDESGVQKIYKPEKIKAYGFGDQHFVSYESDGETFFFNRVISGEISLFKLGIESMRMNKPVYEEVYYLSHASNHELIEVKEGRFKKQLTEWTKDYPDLIEEYGDDKKFEIEKAKEVIMHYNNWKTEHKE